MILEEKAHLVMMIPPTTNSGICSYPETSTCPSITIWTILTCMGIMTAACGISVQK